MTLTRLVRAGGRRGMRCLLAGSVPVFPQKTFIGRSCNPSVYREQAKTAGTEGAGQDSYDFF